MNLALALVWGLDARGTRFWNRVARRPVAGRVFAAVSRLGDGVFWYVLMGTLAVLDPQTGLAVSGRMLAAGLACTLVYKGIKTSVRRTRPCHVLGDLLTTVPPLDRFSFPSGHTMHAVAFTVLATATHPALAWILVPFTMAVALSRLVLGLHYPSDVVFGAALGAFLGRLALSVPLS